MAFLNLFSVFIGGGLGSVLRYLTALTYQDKGGFPYQTLFVNVLASFILGFLFSSLESKFQLPQNVKLMLTTGFCGGLSTFSTFAFETVKLYDAQGLKVAFAYSIISVFLCVLFVWVGIKAGKI